MWGEGDPDRGVGGLGEMDGELAIGVGAVGVGRKVDDGLAVDVASVAFGLGAVVGVLAFGVG